MNIKGFFRKSFSLLKETFNGFSDDQGIKLSASLSYYTIFSLPPLLLIIVSISGFIFGEEAVRGEVFSSIQGLVGKDAAAQIQETLKNIKFSNKSIWATIISAGVLILGASGVFVEIQNSINYIWGIQAKPKKGIFMFIRNRLMSFSMIASIGFLLLVSLIINTAVEILLDTLRNYFSDAVVYLFYILNLLLVFTIISLLIVLIFKTLPDAKISFRDCIVGASFTSILFMVGKLAIGLYMQHSSPGSAFGASSYIILVLVWVYYSAYILYIGAEFTKAYTMKYGKGIIPYEYSVRIEKNIKEIK